MVYKSIHGLAPDYLGSLFTEYDPPYNLRNSENKLAVPLPRTNFLKNSCVVKRIVYPIEMRYINMIYIYIYIYI